LKEHVEHRSVFVNDLPGLPTDNYMHFVEIPPDFPVA